MTSSILLSTAGLSSKMEQFDENRRAKHVMYTSISHTGIIPSPIRNGTSLTSKLHDSQSVI